MVLHFLVSYFARPNSLKKSIAYIAEGNDINVIANDVEGCGNCAGQQQLAT
jgi:hypothetical protein